MKKKGFSLAEFLISLSIISIILILTMPVIKKVTPNNDALYKRAYSLFSQMVVDAISDPELYKRENVANILLDGIVENKQTTFCEDLASKVAIVGEVNCTKSVNIFDRYITESPNFTTTNGMRWYIGSWHTISGAQKNPEFLNGTNYNDVKDDIEYAVIAVDVNGEQGPNRTAYFDNSLKRDIFYIMLLPDGKITVPYPTGSESRTGREFSILTNKKSKYFDR